MDQQFCAWVIPACPLDIIGYDTGVDVAFSQPEMHILSPGFSPDPFA